MRNYVPLGLDDQLPSRGTNANKYRSRLQIIRDILLVAASAEDGSKKTRIMYGANLSYKLVTQYLEQIVKANLLEFDGGSLYTITPKGKEFLSLYEAYEKNRNDLSKYLDQLRDGRDILRRIVGL